MSLFASSAVSAAAFTTASMAASPLTGVSGTAGEEEAAAEEEEATEEAAEEEEEEEEVAGEAEEEAEAPRCIFDRSARGVKVLWSAISCSRRWEY